MAGLLETSVYKDGSIATSRPMAGASILPKLALFFLYARTHSDGDARLGLDRLARDHELDDHERLFLVVLVVPCLGERMADQVFGNLGHGFYGSVSVEDLIGLTDPPRLADVLDARRYFTGVRTRRRRRRRHPPSASDLGAAAMAELHDRCVDLCDLWEPG